jgi:hypothetical protein
MVFSSILFLKVIGKGVKNKNKQAQTLATNQMAGQLSPGITPY